MREAPFSYACAGCGRCCFDKRIVVSPYELARIADALALSTTAVIERYTTDHGTVLRQRDDGGCSLLDGKACGVHPGRPLVCRLYPLGRVVDPDGAESFVMLRGHPESEGELGENGTIGEFLERQGTAPYVTATARYFALFERLVEVLRKRPEGNETFARVLSQRAGASADSASGGATELDVLEWIDVDRTLARRAEGEPPRDVEARVELHLRLLEREVEALEARSA